jgi:hypothetical protein
MDVVEMVLRTFENVIGACRPQSTLVSICIAVVLTGGSHFYVNNTNMLHYGEQE